MADWGNTFNLGDTLSTIAVLKASKAREQYLASEAERQARKDQEDAEKSQREAQLKAFALKRMMASDIVQRARAAGVPDDQLPAKVAELLPGYQRAYSQSGLGEWGDTTPDDVLSLASPDEAELEARKKAMVTGAEMSVRSEYGDTPRDKFKLETLTAQRGKLPERYRWGANGQAELIPGLPEAMTPEKELEQKLAFEEQQHKYRMEEKGAPSYADLNPQTKAPTYEQGRASSFLDRMRAATSVIDELSRSGYAPDMGYGMASKLGGLNETIGRSRYASMDPQGQKWAQAEDEWVNALLRTDTGAAYKDMEVNDLKAMFFPRAGEDEEVKAQKRTARDALMQGMVPMTGPAGMRGSAGRKPLPPGFMPLPDGRVRGPDGRTYRYAQ